MASFGFVSPNFSSLFVGTRCSGAARSVRINRARTHVAPTALTPPAIGEMSLPKELAEMVASFAAVPDVKLRYQQLLFFAQKLPPMDDSLKTEENLVRGCQSVVHIFVSLDEEGRVNIQADSDAQLTKGLVALIVRGFNGATAEEVLAADPAFLAASGLSAALTPARNNGFASAFALVKTKITELLEDTNGPRYKSIVLKLSSELKPIVLDIVDESEKHMGHAGMRGRQWGESHFKMKVVSDKFEGLSLVERHRTIYDILEEEMAPGGIHAITIDARTPSEVKR